MIIIPQLAFNERCSVPQAPRAADSLVSVSDWLMADQKRILSIRPSNLAFRASTTEPSADLCREKCSFSFLRTLVSFVNLAM